MNDISTAALTTVLVLGVALGAVVPVVSLTVVAEANSCNPCTLGGTPTEGALEIEIDDGNIGVNRYDGSSFVEQYYSFDSSDTAVYVGGTVYDIPHGGTADAGNNNLAVSNQYTTNGGDTVVTEYSDPGAGFTLVQRVTYSGTQQYFDMTWEVTNVDDNGGDLTGVRLLHGKDTYLAGGDSGEGFWNSGTNTIGVKKDVSGEENRLTLRGLTDPYNYQSDQFSNIDSSMTDGALTGNVDTSFHDNGYAMEWRTSSIADGNTWTVNARESFTLSSVVVSPPSKQTLSGDTVDLTFDVQNTGSLDTSVSFTTNGPSGWSVTTPSDRTITSGTTDQVTVTVDPPDSVSRGDYDVTLTATPSSGSSDSGAGQIEVPNNPPTASDDSASTDEDSSITYDVVANDGDPDGDSLDATSITNGPSHGTAEITGASNDKIQFDPGVDRNSDVSITYMVSDGNGGTDTATLDLTVDPVNDAPTLSTAIRSLDTIDEDATANSGTTVSSILSSAGSTSDAEGDTLGVAITGVDDTDGVWEYSTDAGSSWNTVTSTAPSDGSALLLADDDLVRFVPDADFSGNAGGSVTVRAWDQTSGTAGDTSVDVSTNGGPTAFSSDAATASISVDNAPEVSSITRASPTSQDTNAGSVDFDVTFSTEVDGIDTSDFTLDTTGSASGTIQSVGSGTASNTVTVTVDSITGDGDLRLDVSDDDTIKDTINNVALGGEGTGGSADGSFTSGESYTVDNTASSFAGGYPAISNVGFDGFDLDVKADEAGTTYYVVVQEESGEPSVSQITNGNSADGSRARESGSFSITANTEQSSTISGLSEYTRYDVYVVVEDEAGNTNKASRLDELTDSVSATFPIQTDFDVASPTGWSFYDDAVSGVQPGDESETALRLTTNSEDRAGTGVYTRSFPTSDGVTVDFRYYADEGSGADGISFFLLNASLVDTATFQTGASGGSLGYSGDPEGGRGLGVPGGFIAIGFDEFGNFANTDGCHDGGTGSSENPGVTVRGAGDLGPPNDNCGATTNNYPFLEHQDPSQSIDGGWRQVRVTTDPTAGGSNEIGVRVEMSFDGGSTWETVIDSEYSETQIGSEFPSRFYLGFSGSTGGSTNVHAIDDVPINQPADLTTTVTSQPSSGPYGGGETVEYTFTVSNNGPSDDSSITLSPTVTTGSSGLESIDWDIGGDGSFETTDSTSRTVSLNSGQTKTVTLRATVGASASGNLDHDITATPSSGLSDPSPSDAAASVSLPVDNTAPTLDGAAKATDTTIDVDLSESGAGFDVSTIEQGDFSLDSGTIASIDTSSISDGDTGTQTVTINLDSPVDDDTVTVSLQSDGIDDMNGNTRTTGSANAANMDGVAPTLDGAAKVDDTTIDIDLSDSGAGFDVSTIEQDDFSLDSGTISGIDTSSISDGDTGTQTVTINLDSPVDDDSVTVSLQSDGIDDMNGNTRTSGSADATNMDGVAPTLDGASKVDATTIDVDLSDGGSGIDEASISSGDFTLDSGSISSIDTSGVTDGATGAQTVTITLASAVDANSVSVSLQSDGIDDKNGNTRTTGSATVSNMDGVAPTLDGASNVDATTIDVDLSDGGSGIEKSSIDPGDFTLDSGSVSSIDTSSVTDGATGTQTVTINLNSPVDASSVSVSLQSDGIDDKNGNTQTSGSASASNIDGVAPTLDSASNVDDTTIDVDISDGGSGIEKSSISSGDFSLNSGSISSIDTSGVTDGATGTQTVTINLASPVDTNSIMVNLQADGIDDKNGNSRTSGSASASGMDGVAPTLDSAAKVDDTTIQVTITDGVDVDESTISQSDFSLSTGSIASVTPTESGSDATVDIDLASAVDADTVDVTISGSIDDTSGNSLTSGSKTASNMDGVAPTLDSASNVDDTTIDIDISDGGSGIEKSSISSGDFSLSSGSISSIDTSGVTDGATGTQTVTINLASPVDTDSVTVSLQSDGIDDKNGNTQTSGSASASGMDGVAPTFDSASKVDDTTIQVTIKDGADVDEATITASDFSLSSGSITSVTPSESGTDATVDIDLASAVDANTVDVSITGSIDDTSGNSLTSGSKTASNMDGVAPTLDGASRVDDTTIDVDLSESGAGFDVSTIEQGDFSLDSGTIASIDTSSISDGDTGTQTVSINLGSAVDDDTVTVSLQSDGIDDMNGNTRTTGSANAANMDGVAPTLDGASNVDATTIDVDLSDGGSGIEKSSIDQSDFSLDSGSISSIDTSGVTDGATGTQTVTITLASAVDTDSITVDLQSDGIDDKNGNTRTSGSASASGMDGVAPTLDGASKVDTTTIDVDISDSGSGIEKTSIDSGDFTLDSGSISSIDTSGVTDGATGTQTVTINLASPVDASSVSVSLQSDGIDDKSGNTQTSGSASASNMDGIAPTLDDASNVDATTIDVDISDGGSGIDEASIDPGDFSLDSGSISSIDTSGVTDGATGTQTVTITLASPVDADSVTVTLQSDGIDDKSSNTQTGGSATASNIDGVAPTLDSASNVDDTTIDVDISDGGSGIEKSSISSGDFSLNSGSISSIDTSGVTDGATGTQTVTINFASPVDTNSITVNLQADGINDKNGNTRTSGSASASNMDGVAPTYNDISKVGDTTIRVTVTDGVDVDETTISQSDFSLSSGTISSVTTSESGSDSTVDIDLSSAVDADSIDVSIVGSIDDTSGNSLTTGTKTASSMDGVAPTLDGASNVDATTIQVTLTDGVDVDETSIETSDFSLSSGSIASVTPTESGSDSTVDIDLSSAVDADTVDVSIVGSIDDTSGNSLTSGSKTASNMDGVAPTYNDISKVGDTTIRVTITDGVDVDETTISQSDFSLSSGTISSVTPTESGSDSTVDIDLSSPVDADTVDVSITGSIDDTSGNSLNSGSKTASNMDGIAPTLDGASKVDATTIQVTLTDGVDVDESTISQSDFSLSTGSITSVTTSESGSDSTVDIDLSSAVDADTVDVSIVGSIDDTSGNSLSSGSKTASNMDGVAPTYNDISKVGDTTIRVTVTDGVDVDETTISAGDFSLSSGSIASVTPTESGSDSTVDIDLSSAVDADTVDVSIVGSIDDTSGNSLTTGTKTASSMDGVAPTYNDISKVGDTIIRVTITDGVDVDETTISASDFSLSNGSIASVTPTESGSDATVDIDLSSPVDADTVDVSIVGSIDDTSGNSLTTGTKTASSMDSIAPTLDDASKVDATTIQVTITDGVDVDEATITASDFSLSSGSIASVTPTESGSDATVDIDLASAVDADTVDVTISGSIDDTSGNSLTSGSKTASNMDGIAPTLDSASNVDDTTIDVDISDGGSGIEKSSIDSGDFSLSSGSISSIDTSGVTDGATGTQTVTINLASPVDTDSVTVSLQSDGIDDKNDNTRISGSADATGMDGVAPALDSATNVDDTTIQVTITDGVGVDESTISQSDFSLSTGSIASVTPSESGTDATVDIDLTSAVDTDTVDVTISGSIDDTSGNSLTSGTSTASGMDGVAPTFDSVSKIDATTIQATITDGVGVDESTISQSDFSLSTGSITSVTSSESGTDATVDIDLASAVDADTVDVSITGSIDDTSGNSLTSGTSTASGMDGVGPTLSSSTPADDSTGHSLDTSLTLTFSEDIQFGSGSISLNNVDDNTNAETFDVTGDTGSGDGTVSIAGDTLTINPASVLRPDTEYAVQIDSGAIQDVPTGTSANDYAGISNDNDLDFTTADTAPSFTAGASTSVTIDEDSSVDLTGVLEVRDLSASDTLTWTVTSAPGNGTISGVDGESEGISGSNSPHTLSTSPTYTPDTDFVGSDSFDVDIADANPGIVDDTLSVSVTVDPVNDPPTLSTTASDPDFTEGDSPVGVFSGTSTSVVESGQQVQSLTVEVINVADGASEKLTVDGSEVPLTDGTTVTTSTNGLTASVTVSSGTATVTVSGGFSTATATTIVDNLAYENTADDPSTSSDRTVTVTGLTDSGGTSNGGTATSSPGQASTVSLTPVNDPPTLSTTASDLTFTEGGSPVTPFSSASVGVVESGQQVQHLTVEVTNVTGGANELLAVDGSDVALTDGNSVTTSTNGLSTAVSVSSETATVTVSGSLGLSAANTLIDTIAYEHTGDDPTTTDRTITLTGITDDGGTDNGGSNTTTLSQSAAVALTPTNDPPTLSVASRTASFVEDGGPVTPFSGPTVDVVEAGQQISAVTVTVSNVSDGDNETLTVDGTPVTLTDGTSATTANNSLAVAVGVASTTATLTLDGPVSPATAATIVDDLAYNNTNDDPTIINRTVTITRLTDDGGTPNGGQNTSTPALSGTVSVTPTNDPPAFTANESLDPIAVDIDSTNNTGARIDSPELFAEEFTDLDSGDSLAGVVVTADASTDDSGTWQYSTDGGNSWFPVDDGTLAPDAGLLLSNDTRMRFDPNPDADQFTGQRARPGNLTVAPVDDSGTPTVTTGDTRQTYDTTSDGPDAIAGEPDTTVSVVVRNETLIPRAEASSYVLTLESPVTFRANESVVTYGTPAYDWTIDDGGPVTRSGQRVTYNFSTPGEQTVELNVSSDGDSRTDTITLTVRDQQSPTVWLGADRSIREGDTVSFDASTATDNVAITSYEWDVDGDGTTDAAGPNRATLTHTYTDPGVYRATLTVSDAAGNTNTETVLVTVSGPEASASQTALAFGTLATGSTNVSAIELTNTGNVQLDLTRSTITGSNPAAFGLAGQAATALPTVEPGETETVAVAFSPATATSQTATLTLSTNDSDRSTIQVSLAGSGVTSDLGFQTAAADFGQTAAGTQTTATLTLENSGGASVDVQQVQIAGDGADAYTIRDTGGLPGTVGPGSTTTLTVAFAPFTTGEQTAQVRVVTDSGTTLSASLTGTGTGPDIVLRDERITFGDVGVDQTATESVEISNYGSAPLAIDDITTTGQNASVITAGSAPDVIPAGSSATVDIAFTPPEAGEYAALLQVSSNDSTEPTRTVTLTGTGTAASIGIDRETINFGEVGVGDTVTTNITVRNRATSQTDLTIRRTLVTGQNADQFTVARSDLASPLAPGKTRDIEIGFSPTDRGAKQAQLQILSDAGNRPQINVWLSNTRSYIVVQRIRTDTVRGQQNPIVNVGANNVDDESSLSVNTSLPSTREEQVGFDTLNFSSEAPSFRINTTYSATPVGDGQTLEGTALGSDRQVHQYVRLNHSSRAAGFDPARSFVDTEIDVRIRKDRLPDGTTRTDVRLQRYNTTRSQWEALPLTFVGESSTHYFYTVDTPGFSQFAVTVPEAGGPGGGGGGGPSTSPGAGGGGGGGGSVAPAVFTVSTSSSAAAVTPGESVKFEAVITNQGDTTGTFLARFRIDGSVVATERLRVPGGETRTVTYTHTFPVAGSYEVRVTGHAVQTVQVRPGGTPTPTPRSPPETAVTPGPDDDAQVTTGGGRVTDGAGDASERDQGQAQSTTTDSDRGVAGTQTAGSPTRTTTAAGSGSGLSTALVAVILVLVVAVSFMNQLWTAT